MREPLSRDLGPAGEGFDREEWETYAPRARANFPGTPDEVLRQWHYKEWEEVVSLSYWLPVRDLAYRLVSLNREEVLSLRSRLTHATERDGGYWGQQ